MNERAKSIRWTVAALTVVCVAVLWFAVLKFGDRAGSEASASSGTTTQQTTTTTETVTQEQPSADDTQQQTQDAPSMSTGQS